MNAITIREATHNDSPLIASFMREHWGGEPLVVRSKEYFPSKLPGFVAFSNSQLKGFLFYEIQDKDCEIVVFEVFEKFQGLGTMLLQELTNRAKALRCQRVFLMTSNDNLDALRFYQRRGFYICGIHINAMAKSRLLKPSIPETGDYDIPIRDEIDLELIL